MIKAPGEAKALLCAEHKLDVQVDMLFILYAFNPQNFLNLMVLIKDTASMRWWVWYSLTGKSLH